MDGNLDDVGLSSHQYFHAIVQYLSYLLIFVLPFIYSHAGCVLWKSGFTMQFFVADWD